MDEKKEQGGMDVLVTVSGWQDYEDQKQRDDISLTTDGRYYKKGDSYIIVYKESAMTGMEGLTTFITAKGNDTVRMSRKGNMNMEMLFERGQRHLARYHTPQGEMVMSIGGTRIDNRLNDRGGVLDFSYVLEINTAMVSRNRVQIKVKPKA